MANEQSAPPPSRIVAFIPVPPPVDALTFKAFLSEKVPHYSCPICHNESYAIMQFYDANVPSVIPIVVMNPTENNANAFYISLGISCRNCGNMQFFNSESIVNWARIRAQAVESQR